jgi:hypothetical protein
MLTGRAAEARPDINYLHVHPVVLVTPEQARADAYAKPAPVENAETLAARGRMANMRRRTAKRGRDQAARAASDERGAAWIPTSGAARRRAKAIRNRDAVAAMTTDWRDLTPSVFEFSAWRGKRYERDCIEREAPDLLARVIDWCNSHPTDGPLPESGALEMHRNADGTITVLGDIPEVLGISSELLRLAAPQYLSFADGILTMDVLPEPLHYRPLGPDPRSFTVVFERVREA